MSTDEIAPFEDLAQTLHKIPQGFTFTDDDTYLRILKWIFTAEEATVASMMKLKPETSQAIANRLDISTTHIQELLEVMVTKGQIIAYTFGDGKRYGLMPFVIGIYEEQVDRMDREFAQLAEEYFSKSKHSELFGNKPEIFKVIPVNQAIRPELTVYEYQAAETIIENAKSWGVRECICKKQQALLGQDCDFSRNVCMIFSDRENAFENHPLNTPITKEEMLTLLRETEEEGLVHNAMNIQSGQNYICNCCTCCCGVLRGMTQWEQPAAFVKSNYQIEVDHELCTACGNCIDRCQFHAITVDDTSVIDLDKCIGCGVCTIACEDGALALVPRTSSEVTDPPKDFNAWMKQKSLSRKVDPSDLF